MNRIPAEDIRVFTSLQTLSESAAKGISLLAQSAIAERGHFMLALSGGNTPRTLYELLAEDYHDSIDWQHVHFFWGDERYVPHDDLKSNYHLAKESLLDYIPVTIENIHPIPTSFSNPEKAAEAYENDLADVFSESMPTFDLILLGLGSDGHTVSVFPGTPLRVDDRRNVIVTESPVPPQIRLSLTFSAIDRAQNIFFLVSGEEKSLILKNVLENKQAIEPKYPASRVKSNGTLTWFVDQAAAKDWEQSIKK